MFGIKESILIVDDMKDIREVIIMMFEDMDCVECFVAENGQQALDILDQFPIQVIVTDIKMPEVDGVQLCKQVRLKGFEGPIVVVTGEASSRDFKQLCQLQIEKFYFKPVNLDEMKKHLRSLLHNEILKLVEAESLRVLASKLGLEDDYLRLSTTQKVKLLLPLIEDDEQQAG